MSNVSDERLQSILANEYGLSGVSLKPLVAGNDADARSFFVRARDGRYLLRLRRGGAPQGSLLALSAMATSGVPQLASVVAPLESRVGELSLSVGSHSASLYRYIDGTNGLERPLSNEQWVGLGRFVRSLHEFEPAQTVRDLLPVESFVPAWAETVQRLDGWTSGDSGDGSVTRTAEFARFWRERRETIMHLLAKGFEIGRAAGNRRPRLVLCHADIHPANVLVTLTGQLRIVDWDGMLFAPPERDLMFVSKAHAEQFYRGYGSCNTDPLIIAYYRIEWAIQEIGDFGRRIVPTMEENLEARFRDEALDGLVRLFEPGNEIAQAYEALKAAGFRNE